MNNLKNSLRSKTDIKISKNFDNDFFDKLHKEQVRPKIFSTWITWLITGCATASVLFFAVANYNVRSQHEFNHKEYINSILELQDTVNDGISDDKTIDLTLMHSDEI